MNILPPRSANGDAGSISVELAVLTPLFGMLLLTVVAVGRVQNARADIEGAARAAARDLSIARDPSNEVGRVRSETSSIVRAGSPGCQTFTLAPTIAADSVTVTISCVADLQDASILPLPGHMTLTATATEVIDTFKESM
jgi:Flp pilus assembly protein TadG